MEAKELRIGNWYQWAGFSSIGKGQDTIKDGKDIDFLPNHRRGIPLTPEWLLKLGFEKHESENFVSSIIMTKKIAESGLKKIVLFNYPKEGWSVGFVDYYTGKEKTETLPTEIKYVHTLQNIFFSLTGQELTLIK